MAFFPAGGLFSAVPFAPSCFRAELIPLDFDAIRLGKLGNTPYQRAWPPRTVPKMPKKGFTRSVEQDAGSSVGFSPNGVGSSSSYKPKIFGNSPFLTFKKPGLATKLPGGPPVPYEPSKALW
mmetsp:Transcript_23889/g.39288  ORF Transcript_23889/g.39288 Transcript_23889/m.39288 type:complete len:122 (+) Transcript_23889:150-515(+)|eukprot:CAMPEP_0184655934 /NCGR_PEP_ID=MMETSP0308-20130426/14973_1 /TAXON_ID=38269 /ORGANISM="Gloeochaete witrockiana, Strain SAG 46.84" /LENGTH=121 /DNA_ID=CAMNT_0027092763 /DNA_START=120 /DNA_END=485 /DNA_ORIENTATION=+